NLAFCPNDSLWQIGIKLVGLLLLPICFLLIAYGAHQLMEFGAQQPQLREEPVTNRYEPLSGNIHAMTGLIGVSIFWQKSQPLGVNYVTKIGISLRLPSVSVLDEHSDAHLLM